MILALRRAQSELMEFLIHQILPQSLLLQQLLFHQPLHHQLILLGLLS